MTANNGIPDFKLSQMLPKRNCYVEEGITEYKSKLLLNNLFLILLSLKNILGEDFFER